MFFRWIGAFCIINLKDRELFDDVFRPRCGSIALAAALPLCVFVLSLIIAPRPAVAVSLEDLWSGEARFQIEPTQIAEDVWQMHFISMFWDDVPGDPHFKAYYIGPDSSTALAKSYDGVHFTDLGKVLETGPEGSFDDECATFSSVMKDDAGVYHLVYEAAGVRGNVAYATSTDGIHFTKHGVILPHDESPGSFESTNNGTPSLHKEGDTWYLYYHGYDSEDCQVGLATGTDIMSLTRVSTDPIIPTSPTGWDSGTMGKRSRPIKQGDYWYMAIEASTDQPYNVAQWTTGIVRSADLIHWEKCPLGNVLPQTYDWMGFDGSDMIQIGDDTYVYFRSGPNNTQRAKLVAGSAETCGIVVEDGDISSNVQYVYELDTDSMGDASRFHADAAASCNIDLTAVGQGDPAPHFYAATGERDAYLEFRFDFSKSSFRATRASIRETLALFRISDHPQETTAITEWSTDQVIWHTLRELETPDWPGHAVGTSSQGTQEIALAGERGLCETLFYRVYFKGHEPFGWNWNQWNRDSDNQFRVACDVVPDDYVSATSDLLLGADYGTAALIEEAQSYWFRPYNNSGHIKITGDDLKHGFTVLLSFMGPQDEVDALIAELLASPVGTEYRSASVTNPALEELGCDIALRFDPPADGEFTFNWHFAGHPEVLLWQAYVVPEPTLWLTGVVLAALGVIRRRRGSAS